MVQLLPSHIVTSALLNILVSSVTEERKFNKIIFGKFYRKELNSRHQG